MYYSDSKGNIDYIHGTQAKREWLNDQCSLCSGKWDTLISQLQRQGLQYVIIAYDILVAVLRSSTMKNSLPWTARKRRQRVLERFRGQERGLLWICQVDKGSVEAQKCCFLRYCLHDSIAATFVLNLGPSELPSRKSCPALSGFLVLVAHVDKSFVVTIWPLTFNQRPPGAYLCELFSRAI